MAIGRKAVAILLDDDPARKLAVQLGLPVIGTAGVLVLAKERQFIPAVRPCLELFSGALFLRFDSQARWRDVTRVAVGLFCA